ncbi:MAG: IS66 family transposase [Cyanobacteria bacterium P01_C01_bin.120]
MKKSNSPMELSEAEIRAVYAQGEEAVVALVSELLKQFQQQSARLDKLEEQVSKTSRNSSKPPSGDGFGKRTKSLRRRSDQPSGGQAEHPGQTLEWRDEPDIERLHPLQSCPDCGGALEHAPVKQVYARQVFDLPAVDLLVTEHQVEVKHCQQCGASKQAAFPPEASNVVQYGPRLKGMMTYLMDGQLLPSKRTGEILQDLMGVSVSEGTLYTTREDCFERLEPVMSAVQDQIRNAAVVHFDETGLRVKHQLWWLHVAATDGLTAYFVHPKRGREAMDAMGILPTFEGKAIHDGWHSYAQYEGCEHFLFNAHHLRELQFIWERYEQTWAFQLSLLLVSIHSHVEQLRAAAAEALTAAPLAAYEARYDAILEQGLRANPLPTLAPDASKQRGRPKRSPPRNLLERLHKHKASVLGFMHDFIIPFDNNQAERDVRMMKLKQKISGCFRSEDGAKMFCRIRGYLATMRKQGHNVFEALVDLFAGNPRLPLPQAE